MSENFPNIWSLNKIILDNPQVKKKKSNVTLENFLNWMKMKTPISNSLDLAVEIIRKGGH